MLSKRKLNDQKITLLKIHKKQWEKNAGLILTCFSHYLTPLYVFDLIPHFFPPSQNNQMPKLEENRFINFIC